MSSQPHDTDIYVFIQGKCVAIQIETFICIGQIVTLVISFLEYTVFTYFDPCFEEFLLEICMYIYIYMCVFPIIVLYLFHISNAIYAEDLATQGARWIYQ